MAKELFRTQRFQDKSLQLVNYCNHVIRSYLQAGLRLTLRQLYYQLVSANVIPNTEKSYKNIGNLISKARLAGLVDWDAIEDRVRRPVIWAESDSIAENVRDAVHNFRLPRLEGQHHYVELWVEKDALAGVLEPLAAEYHIVLMVNRGYSSQSAMYESANRLERRVERYGCDRAYILYLGDHDPSGEDMVRDIDERLNLFYSGYGPSVVVEKVALTMEQVEEHSLPPNPAKLSDSRAKEYIKRFGRESWEVDALPPDVLQGIIEEAILEHLDLEMMEEVKEREAAEKARLSQLLTKLGD